MFGSEAAWWWRLCSERDTRAVQSNSRERKFQDLVDDLHTGISVESENIVKMKSN